MCIREDIAWRFGFDYRDQFGPDVLGDFRPEVRQTFATTALSGSSNLDWPSISAIPRVISAS